MTKNRLKSRGVVLGSWGDVYVDELIKSGAYNSVSEIIREALRLHNKVEVKVRLAV